MIQGRLSDYLKCTGWLVVLGLMTLWDSISVYIGPSPRTRRKKKRKDRQQKNIQITPPSSTGPGNLQKDRLYVKGQIICQRTDLRICYTPDWSCKNWMFVGKNVQIVISAFSCSAEDVHFMTFSPYEQAMAFKNSVISAELTNYVCYVILHWAFLQQTVITVTAEWEAYHHAKLQSK